MVVVWRLCRHAVVWWLEPSYYKTQYLCPLCMRNYKSIIYSLRPASTKRTRIQHTYAATAPQDYWTGTLNLSQHKSVASTKNNNKSPIITTIYEAAAHVVLALAMWLGLPTVPESPRLCQNLNCCPVSRVDAKLSRKFWGNIIVKYLEKSFFDRHIGKLPRGGPGM